MYLTMDFYCIESPIGWLKIQGDDQFIHEISFIPGETLNRENPLLKFCAEQLDAYFLGKLKTFDVPITIRGTGFQQRVLNRVREIPYGVTRSYADIALELEKPHAVRAVGNANGNNPLAIIIPCHRVIGSDGSLTGYAGGIWRKKWLLQHELSKTPLPLFSSAPS
ncbi:MAG: methylated-DNA--[protein]-cysteine S-methyltransferase [Cyclobacteriaceae bacterium]|nr:methylated-DNA--[protein]-cysteine S-methyltransferase [Cyclobacteriaceae bacterium]